MDTYDFIIIGGGIVGALVARFLSRYQLDILLIEKEADLAMGASSANSAIVHAGYDPLPGTMKAIMNVAANPMWDSLANELGFLFERRGDYVVAIGVDEISKLDNLLNQGIRNGVPGLRIISAEDMRQREPSINPLVAGALWAPTGGICDPFGATIAAAENAIQNGARVMLKTTFLDFIVDESNGSLHRITGVRTSQGDFYTRWVVNAAGIFSDQVMHQIGLRPEFNIQPRRGQYFVLDQAEVNLQSVLFPVPSDVSKGILVAATIHGNPILGPNSESIADREDTAVTKEGLAEVWQGARKLVPSLNPRQVISTFAGLRARGNAASPNATLSYNQDFVIEIPSKVHGLVNLGGIESPGLTSAPAIALYVIELLKDAGEKLKEKHDWQPVRPSRPRLRHLSREEQARLIEHDANFGRVICRCELVTEGEIRAEVHAPLPAQTYDAIKRRTWLGTGRCLGGFDTPRVVQILADELGISPLEVSKKGQGSEFLMRETKD